MAVSTELAAILAASGGAGLTALGTGQWRRVKPQNTRDIIESASVLGQAYGALVDDLRKELAEVRNENRDLRDRLVALETLLAARGVMFKEGTE